MQRTISGSAISRTVYGYPANDRELDLNSLNEVVSKDSQAKIIAAFVKKQQAGMAYREDFHMKS